MLSVRSGVPAGKVNVWRSPMAHLLGGLALGQLGPDQVPIVGAKVAASDGAVCCALDGMAVHRPRTAVCVTVLPLADLCITGDSNGLA
jgi:hypothetical protein